MSFTIPDLAGSSAEQVAQAQVDSVDFAIMTGGMAMNGVLSGCAVTQQGSPNMTVAVATGVVVYNGAQIIVLAANGTITTAPSTNPRFDLVTISNAGAVVVVAGTAAANPVFPTTTNVVLASVYVGVNVTSITTADVIDKRLICNSPFEIDYSERNTTFDIQAIGTTLTDVEGLLVIVPPQVRPFRIDCWALITFNTGTAAAGNVQQVNFTLIDYTSGSTNVAFSSTYGASTAVTGRTLQSPITLSRRFPPNPSTRYFKIAAKQVLATITNWTSTGIFAGDIPNDTLPPAYIQAVSC